MEAEDLSAKPRQLSRRTSSIERRVGGCDEDTVLEGSLVTGGEFRRSGLKAVGEDER